LENKIINHLTIVRSNFVFGLQVWALIKNQKTVDVIRYHRIVVTSGEIIAIPPNSSHFLEEGEKFYLASFEGSDIQDFDNAALEFIKLHLRTFVTESFEKIRQFCEEQNESTSLKRQSWYQFARMVRNSLKHNQRWNFNKYDLSLLPIDWNGKFIDSTMNNQEMTWSFFDSFDALELWDEIFSFAERVIDSKKGEIDK
jgi:hypothetical protein